MNTILIIKSLFIGLIWAGSFYLVISYIFPIFPMPQLLYIRNFLNRHSDKIALYDEEKGRKRWNFYKGIMKLLTALIWIGLSVLFAYLLISVLQAYIPIENEQFWVYYGIAIALPSLVILVKGISIYRKAAKNSKPKEWVQGVVR